MRVWGRIARKVTILMLSLTLGGCTSTLWDRYPPPPPVQAGAIAGAASGGLIGAAAGGGGFAVGAVIGGVVGASVGDIINHYNMNKSLASRLQYNGVAVIRIGDTVKLLLPSNRFFMQDSSQLNIQYYPVLNRVGEYLNKFQKISIKVSAYTDNRGSWRRNLALSQAQARHIMIYLWNYGVDTRLIYAKGFGDKYPIATNKTLRGQRLNSRVEITLQSIADNNVYI